MFKHDDGKKILFSSGKSSSLLFLDASVYETKIEDLEMAAQWAVVLLNSIEE